MSKPKDYLIQIEGRKSRVVQAQCPYDACFAYLRSEGIVSPPEGLEVFCNGQLLYTFEKFNKENKHA